jgi:AcrR family transcriptional regulator
LLAVACQVFARDGYRGASMEAIADAAGVTKPVLYQHFPSKRALYTDLLATEIDRLHGQVDSALRVAGDNAERLRRGFGAYLRFVDAREDAFRLLFTEALGLDASFQHRVTRFRQWVADRITAIIQAEAGVLEVRFERTSGRTGPGAGRPSKLYRRAECDVAVSLPERRYDLAGGLLAAALDEADPDARNIVELLDASPGAYERAQLGLEQSRAGQTIALDEL